MFTRKDSNSVLHCNVHWICCCLFHIISLNLIQIFILGSNIFKLYVFAFAISSWIELRKIDGRFFHWIFFTILFFHIKNWMNKLPSKRAPILFNYKYHSRKKIIPKNPQHAFHFGNFLFAKNMRHSSPYHCYHCLFM